MSTAVRTNIFVSVQRLRLEIAFQGRMVCWGAVHVTQKMLYCRKSSPYIAFKLDRNGKKRH